MSATGDPPVGFASPYEIDTTATVALPLQRHHEPVIVTRCIPVGTEIVRSAELNRLRAIERQAREALAWFDEAPEGQRQRALLAAALEARP